MWLRIVDIDLDATCVHLEVALGCSTDCLVRLESFLSRCADEGIYDIRLYHRRGMSKRDIARLEHFAELKRLQPPRLSPSHSAGRRQNSRFRSELPPRTPARATDRQDVKYEIDVDGLGGAVETLHTMTALVCAGENLDARSTLLLRLCVYELASNSVEHGTFSTDTPNISLGLAFSRNIVTVTYQDNADVFLTTSASEIDLLSERIKTNSKRGLGLYMLNKICVDFGYERIGKRNKTSFSLDMSRERQTTTTR